MTPTTIGRDPDRIDIDATPGEPVDLTVSVLDANGAVQPLAGWTLSATVPGRHTFATTYVAGEGVRVTVTGTETQAWADWLDPSARWSLWLTPPASEPYLHAAGWVRVTTH